MKKIFIEIRCLFIVIPTFLSCNVAGAQPIVSIRANIIKGGSETDKIYLIGLKEHHNNNGFMGEIDDSTVIQNGAFTFKFPFTKPVSLMIISTKAFQYGFSPVYYVISGPGSLTLNDVDASFGVVPKDIEGIEGARDFFDLQCKTKPTETKQKFAAYMDKYADDSVYAAAGLKQGKIYVSRKLISPDDYKNAYDHLSAHIKQDKSLVEFRDFIDGLNSSITGERIKDFTISQKDGSLITSAELKGKYVLLDFWASWCGPCKQAFPSMKELYAKYKSNNFEILSISIDADKNDWLRELDNQQLPWLSGWDEGGKKVANPDFGVVAIPATFLIDPDGKIIEKETGFVKSGAIVAKLKAVFGK